MTPKHGGKCSASCKVAEFLLSIVVKLRKSRNLSWAQDNNIFYCAKVQNRISVIASAEWVAFKLSFVRQLSSTIDVSFRRKLTETLISWCALFSNSFSESIVSFWFLVICCCHLLEWSTGNILRMLWKSFLSCAIFETSLDAQHGSSHYWILCK